jgi:hypothetical protein
VRGALFDDDPPFMYMATFDTDFDKYVEDVATLFKRAESAGVIPLFACMEGSPQDWKENPAAFAKWARELNVPSSVEYAKYPDTTGVEVVKALMVKQAHSPGVLATHASAR